MTKSFEWDKTVEFEAYSNWTDYKGVLIPTALTWRELFVAVATLMITIKSVDLIHYELNYTLYGQEPVFVVRDFDFNTFLLKFMSAGMIEIQNSKKQDGSIALLTEDGKRFLTENNSIGIDFFDKKRTEAKKIIDSCVIV